MRFIRGYRCIEREKDIFFKLARNKTFKGVRTSFKCCAIEHFSSVYIFRIVATCFVYGSVYNTTTSDGIPFLFLCIYVET